MWWSNACANRCVLEGKSDLGSFRLADSALRTSYIVIVRDFPPTQSCIKHAASSIPIRIGHRHRHMLHLTHPRAHHQEASKCIVASICEEGPNDQGTRRFLPQVQARRHGYQWRPHAYHALSCRKVSGCFASDECRSSLIVLYQMGRQGSCDQSCRPPQIDVA